MAPFVWLENTLNKQTNDFNPFC